MILLGGPSFCESKDPAQIAQAHVEWGYRAAYCPPLDVNDKAGIRAVREAFAARGIVIAEVGAWCNIIGPDEQVRARNLKHVCSQLALADEVGALCCVDYAGTLRPDCEHFAHEANFSREVFDRVVETVRLIVDQVAPKRARFCLEMMQTCPPDSVDNYLDLIKAVDRPAFAVHLDPVNILYAPRDCYDNARLLRDCVERLGPWIVSCHAKDLTIGDGLAVHINECIPGTGILDYKQYVAGLKRLGRDVPLMLEHLRNSDDYRQARDFVSPLIA